MSRLLSSAAIHDPTPHAPPRPTEPAIQTHPTTSATSHRAGTAWAGAAFWPWHVAPADGTSGTKDSGASCHDRLHDAWQRQAWTELVTVAREQLKAHGNVDVPELHPISRAAIDFFRPKGPALAFHHIEAFVRSLDQTALKSYRTSSGPADRNRLADHALARQCLGTLGEGAFDPVAALRALTAFAIATTHASPREGAKTSVNLGLIRQALHAGVYLPSWSFRIDPCADPKQPGHPPAKVPLEIKLDRIERKRSGPSGEKCCVCEEEDVCAPQDPCCATIRYYITDLLELRDWTHRYKAGDLAYIEIVAAGEKRKRQHEMRRTRETFAEQETAARSLERRDHQVTERSSLQREIERQADASTSIDASVEASYDSGMYRARLSAAFAADRSTSEALREAQEKAREVVTNAVTEIEKQTRTLRSERVTTEEIEKNTHSFANAGPSPLVTKYFWVTQEKRAQLFSYDKHLITELIIPSPARLFEHLLEARREAEVAKIPKPTAAAPIKPADLPFAATDLTAANYASHALQYGVSSPPAPPDETKSVSASTAYNKTVWGQKTLTPVQLQVPPDYHAVALSVSGNVDYRSSVFSPRKIQFTLSNTGVELNVNGNSAPATLSNLTGDAYVDVIAHNINNFTATLALTVKINATVWVAWQNTVFQAIQASHSEMLAAYQTALEVYDAKWAEYRAACEKLRRELRDKETSRHPFYNREIERTELKRAAIYLLCQNFSTEGAVLPKTEPCGFPEIDRSEADARGYDWYFWDRMFDWKHLSYAFFDYFWNPMCSWADRFDPDEPDALFKAFLRAGYARVLIPVSPDMEEDFLYYASTRQKWGHTGEPPLDPDDPRWRDVVFEMEHASESAMTPREGFIADAVPGSLTLLLKGSDRYWDPAANGGAGDSDHDAVALDIDRELLIDGAMYLIADIQPSLDPNAPLYDENDPNRMWWVVKLSRPYEGVATPRQLYSMGAKAVAPVFSFDLPTDLIWAGAHNECLPSYPLPACPS